MKLDKYINLAGSLSRRQAKDLVKQKRVLVNGKTASYKTVISEGDQVVIDGILLQLKQVVQTYIMYNKPKGIICTTEKIPGNIIEAIAHSEKIYPVGRLDKDSEGLILLTNQGEIIDRIANASQQHEKEYIVTLNLPVQKKFLDEIRGGVVILGEKTKPCEAFVEPGTKRIFRIILTQGLNRQIRRMCNAFNYQVIKLQRVRVMNINLGDLKPGTWRDLTKEELTVLLNSL